MKKRKPPKLSETFKFAEFPEGEGYTHILHNWRDILTRLRCSPLITSDEVDLLEACFDVQFSIISTPAVEGIARLAEQCKEPLDRAINCALKTVGRKP